MLEARADSLQHRSAVPVHSVGSSALNIGKGIQRQIDQTMGRPTHRSFPRHSGPKHPGHHEHHSKRQTFYIIDYPSSYYDYSYDEAPDSYFVQFVVNRAVRNEGFDLSRTFGLDRQASYLDTVVIDAQTRQRDAQLYILLDGQTVLTSRIRGRQKLAYDLRRTTSAYRAQPTIGVVFAGAVDLHSVGGRIVSR